MGMGGRSFAAPSFYRFGFNTQEKSLEINSSGSHNTALFWEYDARTGRRWNLDPKYNTDISRYAVNGNNPNYYVDPNGDFKTKFGAKLYKFFHGGEIHQATGGKNKGEYFVGKQVKFTRSGCGVEHEKKFGWGNGGGLNAGNGIDKIGNGINQTKDFLQRNASNVWNSAPARALISDYYYLKFGWKAGPGGYGGQDVSFSLLLRGKDPGLYLNETKKFGIGSSVGGDMGASIGRGYYLGNPRRFSSAVLPGLQVDGSLGVGDKFFVGGSVSGEAEIGFDENKNRETVSFGINFSLGYGLSSPGIIGGGGGGVTSPSIPIIKF